MPDDNVPKYYAVPNPDTGDMTYWERTKDGQYVAWPRKPRAAWYGPPMPSRKEQAQHEDIGAFGRHWWETIRKPWMDTVIAAIEADPEGSSCPVRCLQHTVLCVRQDAYG